MNTIEIYGYAAQEICSGCEGHCGDGACQPGIKKTTETLVEEFTYLLKKAGIPAETYFYEATNENLVRNADVHRVLSMADLAPAIVLNGKLLFFGGFSPEGLVEEVKKRINY
ncbi:hypothetical protein [Gracilinema caldarium]|jgi:hypothetical protein|uniref:Uncharacterized protein n=1 Tax=Gracilinema caldarium (strain ATCC 51460 / DSM 7334 / H1) TaxID=744872 RepID=F8F4F0_GRAC1|nr:hypothetical protein [Gracilinema caldarium]AEJ20597.1 hypothetical protein Spica_2492 [Gracilinema caldarium DSM 7334]